MFVVVVYKCLHFNTKDCLHNYVYKVYRDTEPVLLQQALYNISVGKDRVEAVQPNAPIELLLGTDILHKLGFALTQTGSEDLLKGKTTGSEAAQTTEGGRIK